MNNLEKIRILMIDDDFTGFGGVHEYIARTSRLLRQAGHEVSQLSLSPNQPLDQTDNHLKILRYHFRHKLQWFWSENIFDWILYRQLRRHILSIKPTVIHLHNLSRAPKTILWACRGFKTVQTVHDFSLVCPQSVLISEQGGFKMCLGKRRLRCYRAAGLKWQTILFDYGLFDSGWLKKILINRFLCPSKKMTAICQQAGFTQAVYLPHFVWSESYSPVSELKNILFVGRLVKEKGVALLLQAFSLALVKNNKLRLKIAGAGSELPQLQALADELGIKQAVTFLGWVDSEKLKQHYRECFVVVVPSLVEESFSLVAGEALAIGRPIVAFASGGLPELVRDNINGYLAEKFDIKTLADQLLALSVDNNLVSRMSEQSYQLGGSQFSEARHLDSLLKIYRDLSLNKVYQ